MDAGKTPSAPYAMTEINVGASRAVRDSMNNLQVKVVSFQPNVSTSLLVCMGVLSIGPIYHHVWIVCRKQFLVRLGVLTSTVVDESHAA